jgi:hypothetical protein
MRRLLPESEGGHASRCPIPRDAPKLLNSATDILEHLLIARKQNRTRKTPPEMNISPQTRRRIERTAYNRAASTHSSGLRQGRPVDSAA